MGILNSLTPKSIFVNAIRDICKKAGIRKIILQFCIETDMYNVFAQTEDGKGLKFEITTDEITTLKKLFIRRIVAKWNEMYNDEVKIVIIQVDMQKENFEIFIQNKQDVVLKFDYL